MPYDRYGEWYEEEAMPPPPPKDGEIVGIDDRILARKPGSAEFLTAKGNVPAPDFGMTGGYYGKPDDPHNDPRTDVIYYPDEVHTRKEGGGWDIAERPKPPGKKPSEADLSALAFMKSAQPEIDKEANEFGFTARLRYENSISRSTRALMKPGEFEEKAAEIERGAADSHRTKLTNMYWNEAVRMEQAELKRRETPTEDQRIAGSLQEKLGRRPTDTEFIAEKQRLAIEKEKAKMTAQKDEIEIPLLIKAVGNGQDAPIAIKNTRGANIQAIVKSGVLQEYPKFDFNMSDANYKWKQSATNQRTINFVGGALPRLGALDDQLKKMPNVNINTINRVMAAVSKEFGKPEFTNFEANRNAIVQEINTALSGTSQGSDMRIKIELDNLKSSRSPDQIRGAIENLRMALEARLDVDLSPLYPIEVVRGEKTMEQYKQELYKRYRGNYKPHFGEGNGGNVEGPGAGSRPPLSAFMR